HMSRSRRARSARARATRRSDVPRKPPTITFSSTVMSAKGLTTWKVRPIPAAQTWSGRQPPISWPRKRIRPSSGGITPATRLKSVVLPAPFGPMSATISPRRTASEALATARRPRKLLETPATSSRVSVDSGIVVIPRALEAQAPGDAGPDAMGHEHDRRAQGDAVEDLLDARDLVPGEFERRIDAFRHQRQHRRAEHRPEQGADAADDRRHEDLDRAADVEDLLGKQVVVVEGEEHAGQRGHARRDLHGVHLVAEDVDAGGARRLLVVADRPEVEAQAPSQEPGREQEGRHGEGERQVVE